MYACRARLNLDQPSMQLLRVSHRLVRQPNRHMRENPPSHQTRHKPGPQNDKRGQNTKKKQKLSGSNERLRSYLQTYWKSTARSYYQDCAIGPSRARVVVGVGEVCLFLILTTPFGMCEDELAESGESGNLYCARKTSCPIMARHNFGIALLGQS